MSVVGNRERPAHSAGRRHDPLALPDEKKLRWSDLAGGTPGPFCTMLLGYSGADVIKVEKPPNSPMWACASVFSPS